MREITPNDCLWTAIYNAMNYDYSSCTSEEERENLKKEIVMKEYNSLVAYYKVK